MKIHPRVLIIAFALSTVIGVLSNSYSYLTLILTETQAAIVGGLIVGTLSVIVNPLLFFASFYFIGRRIETNLEFYSYLLSLFLGNAIGLTFGHFVSVMVAQTFFPVPFIVNVITVLAVFVTSLFSLSFFVGFSALALSYIIKKKQ